MSNFPVKIRSSTVAICRTCKNWISRLFGGEPKVKPQDEEGFYVELFTRNPYWSKSEMNQDELSRWKAIETLINGEQGVKFDCIVDFGCGRGWLANELRAFGKTIGIEPVAEVVQHAKSLYKDVEFFVGGVNSLESYKPTLVVASEVIEHVLNEDKVDFLGRIFNSLEPSGHLILTTPRKEVYDEWRRQCPAEQPIEEWLSEDDLRSLSKRAGFNHVRTIRVEQTLTDNNTVSLYQAVLFSRD